MDLNRFGDFDDSDDETWRRMKAHFNPSQIDQSLRSAVQVCWMMIPPSRRTPEEVELQLRRIFERVLKDLQEDYDAFS